MTGVVSRAKFDRALTERGLSTGAFCKTYGISTKTVAKIRRGEPVDIKTIERIAGIIRLVAPRAEITELLAS